MEKLRQGTMLHLGVIGLDDDFLCASRGCHIVNIHVLKFPGHHHIIELRFLSILFCFRIKCCEILGWFLKVNRRVLSEIAVCHSACNTELALVCLGFNS